MIQNNPQPVEAAVHQVLQRMDSVEDGADRYREFLRQASIEHDIGTNELERALEPYI